MKKTIYIPIDTTLYFNVKCSLLIKKLDTLTLNIAVFEKGLLKNISGQTIDLVLKKSDGTNIHKTITDINSNVATITLDNQATSCTGTVEGELVFTDSIGQTFTNTFTYNVKKSLATDIVIKSEDSIETIEDIRILTAKYKEAIEQLGDSTIAAEALVNIKGYIDTNLPDLKNNNALAAYNISVLDSQNTNASENIDDLNVLNNTAEDKLQEFREFDTSNIVSTLRDHGSQLNENTNEIEDTKTDLEVIKTNYAKKTDVNSLASSKAEKVDLQATNAELATQKARIDTFTKLSEGSTTGDAELADIRTKSDGTISVSSGDAVRNQIKSIVNFNGTDIYKYDYEATVSMMVVSNLQIFRGAGYEAHKGAIIPVKANTTYKLSRKKSTSAFKIALLTESEAKSSDTLYLNLNRLIINDNNVNECIFNSGSYTFIAYQNSISNESSDIYLLEDYKVNLNEDLHIKEVEEARIDLNNKKYNNLKSRLDDTQKQLLNSLMCSDINVYDEEVAETYNDYNKFPVNKIILVSAYQNNILNAPYVGFIGTIFTYSAYKNANVCAVQIAIDNNNVLYFRSKYGSDWISWKRNITYTPDYSMMFHKIGGVGDSLMSGELAYGLESENWQGHYLDKYEFSWLSNIARTTGAEYKCYSEGGLRCDTWLEKWKDKLANDEKKCNAYFIGLGTNDKSYSGYSVGTVDDTSSTVSFAGYYKKIIETIQTSAPNAVIFCLSLYDKSDKSIPYSNMVQAITSKYNKCYFLDFANKSDILLSDANYTSWGHFDTLGYIRVAENIKRIINDVVETNRKDLYMFGWNN